FSIKKIEGRFVFAIKPSNYQFSLDKDYQPEFYQNGTDELFNVPLYPSRNEDKYSMVLMGDPQVYAQDQINFLGEVATDELLDADYEFMIVLGDIVGNSLPLLPQVKSTLGLTRKPSYYALGNHDRDRGEFSDPTIQDNNSYEESYGPDYYSFNWGNVHFLVLNDVLTVEKKKKKGSDYIPGIHPMQIEFIKNDLKTVPPEKLVVVCAHIPFFLEAKKTSQTKKMLSLLKNHHKVFMATGHAHNQIQLFFDEDDGWESEQPIHQLVAGAICGNWWRGEPDIFGIPGSMMRDGTPRGYWFMHVDGSDYQLEYKVSGRDKNKQMHIWLPQYFEMDTLSNFNQGSNDIWINVYAGNEFTEVKLRIDNGKWELVKKEIAFDPYVLRILQ
ncbi:MAG: calcineurin-like phosphoesterase C-terminal domain-containing protein, partial [Cyclobacteriaceae bacterium]|nr:calcineurin-like phosphoesterase C-terminal domain-containing protein [Cyclobacteriaceae bacterium]